MAEDKSTQAQDASSPQKGAEPDAIPMKKASPVTWIAAAVGVCVLGGLAAVSLGGSEQPKVSEEPSNGAKAEAGPQLSAKEAEEHLRRTQKALEAAEQAEAAAKAKESAQPPPEEPTPAEEPTEKKTASAPAKKASPQQAKKKLESLDSLGADITSALK